MRAPLLVLQVCIGTADNVEISLDGEILFGRALYDHDPVDISAKKVVYKKLLLIACNTQNSSQHRTGP